MQPTGLRALCGHVAQCMKASACAHLEDISDMCNALVCQMDGCKSLEVLQIQAVKEAQQHHPI
jgi:hypothetical protein